MENRGRKTFALFIIISILYVTLFDWDWDWPSLSHFKFSWAYTIGIAQGVFFCIAERFLKHVDSPDFQWKQLIKTHLFAFLVFCPISIIVILPKLGLPNNTWGTDRLNAFLVTFFLLTVGPKMIVVNERLDKWLASKNGKKKEK